MTITFDALLEVLNIVDSPERTDIQQQAEQQLKNWEVEPGFHFLLQEIYLKTELSLRVRWLAIICFKNGVEKFWRASRANAISKDEKIQIRRRVFDLLDEKNNQLAIQNAHGIARIVRFDFPSEWPDLFDHISKNLEDFIFVGNNLIAANNLLVILNQVVKAVAAVRIGRARHAFQSKAPLLLPVLVKSYIKLFHIWTSSRDLSVMEVCYLCLKNLRRIIPEGFEQPHKNAEITEFFKLSIGHLQGMVMEHDDSCSDLHEKFVKSYSKLYVNLINYNPTGFILMPCAHEIVSTFMTLLRDKAQAIYDSCEENNFWETLALKGFLILKKMINYVFKQGAVTLKQRCDKEEVNHAISLLKSQVFTPQVVTELCDLIINWYLRLKQDDLESWLLEPEEWTNEELSSSWEFQVRPCAENFYQDLIRFFKNELSEFILNKISSGMTNDRSLESLLIKDSTLCTFQLSSDSIADKVNFDQLLSQVFIPEGQLNDQAENKIIKRRICLIISTWVVVDCSRQSRVEIYKLLLDFLDSRNNVNDKVVKLTAVQSLRIMINDWDFVKQDFQPFLTAFVSSLITMLNELSFTESKLYVLDTLAALLERCNPLIDQASLITILKIVPQYWENSSVEANKETILKTSLLRVLKNLVIALNQNSPETHSITLPLIKSCCTQSSEQYYILSEDGYELWLATLQYYPAGVELRPELLELFVLVHPSLVESTEILTTILSIARSYALLTPKAFTSEYGTEIFRVLSGYISTMRDDAFDVFVSLMDILLLSQSEDEQFINILITSSLLNEMLTFVLTENHSIVPANKILSVISRLACASPAAFFQISNLLSINMTKLLEVWASYYKNNGNPRNKKVNLLALLALLAYATPRDQREFAKFLSPVLREGFLYLEEVSEDPSGNSQAYDGDYTYSEIDNYAYLDPDISPHGEKLRYQNLLDTKDPVQTVNLRESLKTKVLEVRQETTEEVFNAIMSLNDQYTNEKLQELLS